MADLKHTFISTLHRELLWMIFLQNVLTPDVYRFTDWTCSPLTTVRYCSQVCRDWRYILLQSSSIWSRVIDLEQLNQRGQDWKKEVLSRTGQAPLWVYGQPNISTMLFFVPFLEENWGRVQRMQIFGLSEMPTDTFTNSLNRLAKISWNFLQKPAPSLRVIDVYLSTAVHLPNSLFGSYAPLLKRFAIQANNYKLNTKDSWLKNLSHVIICGNLAFEDIGGALEQMPNLVTLEICCNNVDLDVAGPAINLPRMKKLCLSLGSNMLNGVALLERIEPASDCCIYIQGGRGEWKPAPEEEEYERYEDAISKHVLPCLKIHPPTVLSYIFTYDTLFIQEPSGALHDPKHFYSELHIPFYFEFFGSSLLMQDLIDSASFSNVTELRLGEWGQSSNFGDLVSALRAFPSVTTLKTAENVLGLLLQNESITRYLIPGSGNCNPEHLGFRDARTRNE